jgi:hypothetical protein
MHPFSATPSESNTRWSLRLTFCDDRAQLAFGARAGARACVLSWRRATGARRVACSCPTMDGRTGASVAVRPAFDRARAPATVEIHIAAPVPAVADERARIRGRTVDGRDVARVSPRTHDGAGVIIGADEHGAVARRIAAAVDLAHVARVASARAFRGALTRARWRRIRRAGPTGCTSRVSATIDDTGRASLSRTP